MFDSHTNVNHSQYISALRELSQIESQNLPFVLITEDRLGDLLTITSTNQAYTISMITRALSEIDLDNRYYPVPDGLL